MFFKNILNFFMDKEEENDDFLDNYDFKSFPNDILDDSNTYPISELKAFNIANMAENLKTDFYKRDKRNISYIYFSNCNINLIDYNNGKYWYIQITNGDLSWIEYKKNDTRYCDGPLLKKDLAKLKCLVNSDTGEYIYHTKKVNY